MWRSGATGPTPSVFDEQPVEVSELPDADSIPEDLLDNLPINYAKQHRVVPVRIDALTGRVLVAIADPLAVHVIDDVRVMLNQPVDEAVWKRKSPTP